MRIKSSYVTTLLATGFAAVGIVAAPTAAAAPLPKLCVASGAGTTCQTPGSVEIVNSPPPVSLYPFGGLPYLLGGL